MAMIVAGVFLMACMDAGTKHLATLYGAQFVIASRYVLSAIVLGVILLPGRGAAVLATSRPWLTIIRSCTIATASLFAASAYARMPVAEATAVIHVAPFIVLLLSGLVLRESVSLPAWLSAFGGMAGLLLITRPESGLLPVAVLLALGAAAMSACYILPHLMPGWLDLAIMVGSSLIGLGGHFLVTAAYREAAAYQLAPLTYVQLLWAGLVGWFLFSDLPDLLAFGGMLLIAASGAALPLWSRYARRP